MTLTTSKNYRYLHFKRLKSDKAQNDRDPGFVFVMNFYKRNSDKNFDEVVYGNSIELGYRDTDLPLYLYSKAIDYHNDIHLSVTFRDSRVDTEGEYKKSLELTINSLNKIEPGIYEKLLEISEKKAN